MLVAVTSPALAETCPVPAGGDAKLASMDAAERIEFLRATVDGQAVYANRWKWAWFAIGSATFLGSVGFTLGWAASSEPPDVKNADVVDNAIVSAFSVVTPVTALLFALRVEDDAPAIDKLLRDTGGGRAGSCLVLERMEELFQKDAAEERLNTGWFAQVAALLGLGAMFTIMAVEAATSSSAAVQSAHWQNAAVNTGVGLVLTEAQILTTPTGAASGWKRYLKGDVRAAVKPRLSVTPFGAGVAVGVAF